MPVKASSDAAQCLQHAAECELQAERALGNRVSPHSIPSEFDIRNLRLTELHVAKIAEDMRSLMAATKRAITESHALLEEADRLLALR